MIDGDFLDTLMASLNDMRRRIEALETVESGGFFFPFTLYQSLQPISGSPTDSHIGPVARDVTLRRFAAAVYVAAPNNGANYWSIAVVAPTTGTLLTLDTSAMAAATWTALASTTFASSEIAAATDLYLLLQVTQTAGAPGDLSLAPSLYVV